MTAPTAAAPRVVTLNLPLPPAVLSPRARAHWGHRAVATKEYRAAAYYSALTQLPPGWRFQRASLAIHYVVCLGNPKGRQGRAQPTDLDAAQSCCKAAIDGGLVDSRLLADDNASRLVAITTTLDRHRLRDCAVGCTGSGVTFTITEVLP